MSVLDSDSTTLATIIEDPGFDEAQVAAAAFLARYNGRALDAYRYDLRTFFQRAADAGLTILEAKRPHIELYRTAMEQKGLGPSTIDRTSPPFVASTGSPTSMVGSPPTRPSTSGAPRSTPPRGEAWIAGSAAPFSSPPSAATEVTPLWPYSSASTDFESARRVEPTSRISPSPRGTGPYESWARGASRR